MLLYERANITGCNRTQYRSPRVEGVKFVVIVNTYLLFLIHRGKADIKLSPSQCPKEMNTVALVSKGVTFGW